MKFFLSCLLLFTSCNFAAVATWHIDNEQSSISFTATQNDAPVTAQFLKFAGSGQFDPSQLDQSHGKITISMDSVKAEYEDLVATLKESVWFDVKAYPQATITIHKIRLVKAPHYQAEATMTLRDQSHPLVLDFELLSYEKDKVKVKGSTTVRRLLFGVGQGEWASTDEIKNEVKVNFTITGVADH